MTSGIKLPDTILNMFQTKLKKSKDIAYMIFKIHVLVQEKKEEIRLSETGTLQDLQGATENYTGKDDEADLKAVHETMRDKLKPGEPCFVFYDFQYSVGGQNHKKILLISWVPEDSKVKAKMLQASTFEAIKKQVEGVKSLQASDTDETEYDQCKSKAVGN